MGTPEEERSHFALLRQRAEEVLKGKKIELDNWSSSDLLYLLHELQVHQAELAMQNEELRQVQLELEASRDRYATLYNFAPAGYSTINRKDRILEANQTMADLVGTDRKKLMQDNLSHYILPDDQDRYYLYRLQAFQQHHKSCEIRLKKTTGENVFVRLEGRTDHADENRLMLMLIDISKQRELQHRLVEQREKERKKIAGDIHDGPVQALAAINFTLQGYLVDYPDAELTPALKAIQNNLREQIQVLRNFSVELQPPLLKHFGLLKAMQSYLESFQQKHPELHLNLRLEPLGTELSETAGIALYRICQEATNNISKHAVPSATEVTVRLAKVHNQARLEVLDNGDGFDPPEQVLDFAADGQLGLLGMHERAEAVGGQLEVRTGRGKGTHIIAMVPMNHSQPE